MAMVNARRAGMRLSGLRAVADIKNGVRPTSVATGIAYPARNAGKNRLFIGNPRDAANAQTKTAQVNTAEKHTYVAVSRNEFVSVVVCRLGKRTPAGTQGSTTQENALLSMRRNSIAAVRHGRKNLGKMRRGKPTPMERWCGCSDGRNADSAVACSGAERRRKGADRDVTKPSIGTRAPKRRTIASTAAQRLSG